MARYIWLVIGTTFVVTAGLGLTGSVVGAQTQESALIPLSPVAKGMTEIHAQQDAMNGRPRAMSSSADEAIDVVPLIGMIGIGLGSLIILGGLVGLVKRRRHPA